MQSEYDDEPWRMDYFGGVQACRENPDWLSTAFICGLCSMIPIVGPIAVLGYVFETAEWFHRSEGSRYASFDFDRFNLYLSRGVGPFLISFFMFMFYMVILIPVSLVFAIVFASFGAAMRSQAEPVALGVFDILFFFGPTLISWALLVCLMMLVFPMQLRSGLACDMGEGFHLGWAFSFLRRTWVEMIACCISLMLILIPTTLVSVVTFGIAMLPATGFFSVLMGWWSFQLYRMHLSRGGRSIPLKRSY